MQSNSDALAATYIKWKKEKNSTLVNFTSFTLIKFTFSSWAFFSILFLKRVSKTDFQNLVKNTILFPCSIVTDIVHIHIYRIYGLYGEYMISNLRYSIFWIVLREEIIFFSSKNKMYKQCLLKHFYIKVNKKSNWRIRKWYIVLQHNG